MIVWHKLSEKLQGICFELKATRRLSILTRISTKGSHAYILTFDCIILYLRAGKAILVQNHAIARITFDCRAGDAITLQAPAKCLQEVDATEYLKADAHFFWFLYVFISFLLSMMSHQLLLFAAATRGSATAEAGAESRGRIHAVAGLARL